MNATLVFPIHTKNRAVLLGMKKYDFGAGKWNGFGGKIRDGETKETAALRELTEEAGISAHQTDLTYHGLLHFHFNEVAGSRFSVHIFTVHTWRGEPCETEEMRPAWFPLDALPYEAMWRADAIWIPRVLAGRRCNGRCYYRAKNPGDMNEEFDCIEWDDNN